MEIRPWLPSALTLQPWAGDLSTPGFTFSACKRVRGNMYLAQLVKNPPAIRETWVWSLGWEDLLEKGKASLLSFPVFWPGEVQGLYSPWGCKELDTTEWLWLHFTSGGKKKKSSTSSFTFLQLRGGVSAPSPWIWVDLNDELVTNRMKLNFQDYSEEAVWFLPGSSGTLAFGALSCCYRLICALPPQIHLLEHPPWVPQNVTFFRNRVFVEVVKLKWSQ